MPTLSSLLGTIMSSVIHARQMADEESGFVAEQYKQNSLLEGCCVPRIRLPKITIDLPLLLNSLDNSTPDTPRDPKVLAAELRSELESEADEIGFALPDGMAASFENNFNRTLKRNQYMNQKSAQQRLPRENIIRIAEETFRMTVRGNEEWRALFEGKHPEQYRKLISELKDRAGQNPIEPGLSSEIVASIRTEEVKTRSDNRNVARIHIEMIEEGLEWNSVSDDNGHTKHKLIPE